MGRNTTGVSDAQIQQALLNGRGCSDRQIAESLGTGQPRVSRNRRRLIVAGKLPERGSTLASNGVKRRINPLNGVPRPWTQEFTNALNGIIAEEMERQRAREIQRATRRTQQGTRREASYRSQATVRAAHTSNRSSNP